MKYIIDIDALKDCLGLLPIPVWHGDNKCVYFDTVKELIDKFPKEKFEDKNIVYRDVE